MQVLTDELGGLRETREQQLFRILIEDAEDLKGGGGGSSFGKSQFLSQKSRGRIGKLFY